MTDEMFIYQRRMLGILCVILAPCSILFGLFGHTNLNLWWDSISATFYANSGSVMIGVLFTTFFYFITYKGYDWKDRVVNVTSAVTALGVVVFPCYGGGLFDLPYSVSNPLHTISATILFLSFAVNCLWLFTQTDTAFPTKEKKNRNILYRICGTEILLSLLIIAIQSMVKTRINGLIMVCEFVALTSYAVAWFTKGELFKSLND